MSENLIIACVKWGRTFPAAWANILYDMVRRNLPETPFDFYCFTDNAADLNPDISARELPGNLNNWWNKLYLFKEGIFPPGQRIIYFDLDTLITGEIDDIVKYSGDFALLGDFYRPGGYGSGVMMWPGGTNHHIWREFEKAGRPNLQGGDQIWLEKTRPGADLLQDLFPGKFASFKVNCRPLPPEGTSVVCFHGEPKQDNADERWVADLWKIGGTFNPGARALSDEPHSCDGADFRTDARSGANSGACPPVELRDDADTGNPPVPPGCAEFAESRRRDACPDDGRSALRASPSDSTNATATQSARLIGKGSRYLSAHEEKIANIRHAISLPYPWLEQKPPHGKTAAIIGGGASLNKHVEEIRQRCTDGDSLFAVNNSAGWLAKNNIGFDNHILSAADFEPINLAGITRYCASTCPPAVFEKAHGNIIIWHPEIPGITELIRLELQNDKRPQEFIRSSAAGLMVVRLVYALGYRTIHLYGFDSCLDENGAHHAYPQPQNDNDRRIETESGGRQFQAAPWMLDQAREFVSLTHEMAGNRCKIKVHGEGLIPYIAGLLNPSLL